MSDLDKFKARMDAKANELMKNHPGYVPLKGMVNSGEIKPLPKVPETPPPWWNMLVLTPEQEAEATKKEIELQSLRNELEAFRRGETPGTYYIRKWLPILLSGIGGFGLSFLSKGCG